MVSNLGYNKQKRMTTSKWEDEKLGRYDSDFAENSYIGRNLGNRSSECNVKQARVNEGVDTWWVPSARQVSMTRGGGR